MYADRFGQHSSANLQPFGPHGYTVTYRGYNQDLLESLRSFQSSLGPGWMSRLEVGTNPQELHMHVFPRAELVHSTLVRPPRYSL